MGAGVAVDLDRARQARCAGCHAAVPAALADSLGFHRVGARNCLDCHSFHDSNVTRGRAAGIRIDAVKSTGAGHCRGCHDPRGKLLELSEGHRAAADLYHSDSQSLQALSPSESCLNCHADALTSRWGEGLGAGIARISEHASHPVGVAVVPGRGSGAAYIRVHLDPRVPLFGGRMECQSCHLLSAGTEDLLVPFPAKLDLCLGCHQTQGPQTAGSSPLAAVLMKR